ncbi:MAG: hypothetical protein PHW15_00795 [Patescibacteria group bacterium]|jgi:hypothetical protein|nr:hypothetical protein [Patescibacteria group bacterium]MDD5173085.1 hypothetical protein [Patescibacteria group bacterium]
MENKPTYQHQDLADGRWFELNFMEQMANVGSEVGRTMSWKEKGDNEYSQKAFARALELLDLTIEDRKNRSKLKEIVRLREVLVDYFFGENQYGSSNRLWHNYFYAFNFAARRNR